MSSTVQARVGQALVDFAVKSQYPDEEVVIAADIESSALPLALDLLSSARHSLEDEIRKNSHEAGPDVDTWIKNAKTLQNDIESSRRLANEIIRKAQADEQREELVVEQEKYVSFLESEVAFNGHLSDSLLVIQELHDCLERVETLIDGRQVLECLTALDVVWNLVPRIPGGTSTGIGRLLNAKALELQETAKDLLRSVWESLIVVDRESGQITINAKLDGEVLTSEVATNSFEALQLLEEKAQKFWYTLDEVIVKPRTDLSRRTLRYIQIEGNTVRLGEETVDFTIKSLFLAMGDLIQYLQDHLAQQFLETVSVVMMPELSAWLRESWLDTSVPSSLDELNEYQKSIYYVHEFSRKLESLSWPGAVAFEDWCKETPKIWLNKRKEIELDWTRGQLSHGVGARRRAEHLECQMVGKDEGKQIASSANVVSQDWHAGWDTDDEDSAPIGSSRASVDEAQEAREISLAPLVAHEDDDDAADAWGWGDEDVVNEATPENNSEPPPRTTIPNSRAIPETREITLSETYYTSSIPQPVFNTVAGLFNDGAKLASAEFKNSIITAAVPGIFTIPRLILTMYRSVSPHYYARHASGNMFAYSDSIWLSDRLAEFQSEWDSRTDLSPRAYGKVNLEPEIKVLLTFGKRAYTNEMNAQRTIITDLLGGAQNFFTEDGTFNGELDAEIEIVVKHVRTVAAQWEPVLSYSARASSVGSLANSVASKVISDIFDLDSVSSNEAERLAALIDKVFELDNLFPLQPAPNEHDNSTNGDDTHAEESIIHHFADRWYKLRSLKLVLESNLDDIKFYWLESALSDHLTAEELVELIGLCFENNAGVRQAKREIKENPSPRGI